VSSGYCDNVPGIIDLEELIAGEDKGGQWLLIQGDNRNFNAAYSAFDPLKASAGRYILQYKVDGAKACVSDSVRIEFEVFNAPKRIIFTNDSLFKCQEAIVLSATSDISPSELSSIQWFAGEEEINGANDLIAHIDDPQSGDYRIRLRDKNGCELEARQRIRIDNASPYFAPNAFSPNYDGINDIFRLYFGDQVHRVNTFRVFDRWGALMYGQNDIDLDSAFGCDGNHILLKGNVTVIW